MVHFPHGHEHPVRGGVRILSVGDRREDPFADCLLHDNSPRGGLHTLRHWAEPVAIGGEAFLGYGRGVLVRQSTGQGRGTKR